MTGVLIWLLALLYVAGAVVTRELVQIGIKVMDGPLLPAWARVFVVVIWPVIALAISVTRIAGDDR